MFPGPIRPGLSFTKVLGGIGKTLNIANQLIPIYVQAKPIIQNARSTFSIAKEILSTPNSSSSNTAKTVVQPEVISSKKESPLVLPNSNPVFFL